LVIALPATARRKGDRRTVLRPAQQYGSTH